MSIFIKKKEKGKEKKEEITVEIPKMPLENIHSKANTLILHKPWITEKTTDLGTVGKYVFVVDKSTNKSEVKKAIESVSKVGVVSVKIINVHSRKRRLGRSIGKKSGFKKAIVTLRPGEAIDITTH